MIARLLPLLAALPAACAGATDRPAAPPAATDASAPVSEREPSAAAGARSADAGGATADASAAPAAARRPIFAFTHDDFAAARERARGENKALFVDAWAPWCHTCLSMQASVLTDAALAPLAERLIAVAIDTDREQNAAFLERHAVAIWPTFFVIDPVKDQVVGYWPGAASAREMAGMIRDALDAIEADRAGALPRGSPAAALVAAKGLQARRRYREAARRFSEAVRLAQPGWPRRSEAIAGWLQALYADGRHAECVAAGLRHLGEVSGAVAPADSAGQLLSCAAGLRSGPRQLEARLAAAARLAEIVAAPSSEASADDRADAWSLLGEALLSLGDRTGARRARERALEILEAAAAAAPAPEVAQAYDYGRANAYLELGRGDEAIAMLQERERQLPASYEPPARLASVLHALGRHGEALAAIDRALSHAYGPRRLRYLATRARIQQALGDRAGAIATLQAEVKGWKELRGGHANDSSRADAERRLRQARAR